VVFPGSEPQFVDGGHVNVQVTPLPDESFWTLASKVMPLPLLPAMAELIWLMLTEIGGGMLIVNVSKSDFVPSAFDMAVSVVLGEAGKLEGGV
jgi:hypothetical protein